jgi:very-short-patch-repair endonuclease
VVHRSTTFVSGESTTHRGIRVTTPARTILDLASVLGPRPLERAIDEAERLSLSDQRDLEALAAAHRGEPGAGVLRRVLRSHTIGSTLTRSELEERFLRLCSDRQLPQPLVNAPLHDLTVDFLWADARVVAELDGRGSHDTRRAFQDDRDRDSLLAAHRYVTLRFTWWDVTQRPAVVADRLRRVLAHRRGEPSIADA